MEGSWLKKKLESKVLSLQWIQLIRAGSIFLISIFLTKIFKDTLVISVFESLLLIGTSFTFFWVSGLLTTFLPFYHGADTSRQERVIFNSFFILTGISLLTFFAVLLIGTIFFKDISTRTVLIFAIYIFFNSPAFLIEYIFLVKDQVRKIYIYSVIVFSAQALLFCIPLLLGMSLDDALLVWVIIAIIKYIYLIFLVFRYSRPGFDRLITKELMLRSSPIIISLLIGGSAEFIDGYLVKWFSDSREFALFRYGARELPLTRILANAMSLVISGEIASALSQGRLGDGLSKLKKSTSVLIDWLFPVTVLLIIISPWLYRVVYNETFVEACVIFNVYLLLIVSRLTFPQTVLLGLQKNTLIMKASIAEMIFHTSLSFIFIKSFGVIGIAFAAVGGEYFNKTWLAVSAKKQGIKLADYAPVTRWLVWSVVVWVVFLVTQLI